MPGLNIIIAKEFELDISEELLLLLFWGGGQLAREIFSNSITNLHCQPIPADGLQISSGGPGFY